MRTSKDKTETESFKLHSQDRCSGFKVSFGGRPNYELNWISPSVGPRGLNQSNGGAFTFEGSDPRLPLSLFPDLERKSNADNISLSNNTHPEALLRPFTLVLDLNTSIQVKSGVYHPLPGAYAFRLLEILPGEADMLECKLHVCNLKENATAYEALSYTWGAPDSSSERKITVISQGINRSMAISGSLHAALRELRRNDASRVVWADAICINQEDGKEKGQQVALMGQIFSGAWQVIVWLGEKSDRCMCGNTVLDTSLSSISKAFSGICSVVNEWLAHGGQETLEATYLEISKDGQSTVHHANTHDDGDRRSAMMQLFQRLWFSRIWVLQEIVLARHAVVQLGSYQIPWEWLGLAAATVVHNPDLLLSNVGRRMIPAGVTNSYLMYRLSVSQSYFSRLELTFTQLLQVSRQFESKEPKDKVYGLLGIETTDSVGKQIIPDYRETTASEKVFEDIARLMLQTTSPLKFLSGTGALRAYVPSGPSWVPSWHKRQPWTLLPIQQNSGFQCASGAPMELHPKQKAGELVLKGVIIDHISSMQEHRYSFGIFGENEKVRDNLLNEPMWSQETWRKCAMTLACGGDGRAYPIDDEAAHLADLAALVLSRSPHWIIRDLIALRDVIEPEGDRMTQAEYLTQTVEGGNSRRYINAVEPIRKPYRLFKTASKDFGVGPVDMKIGDKLCVLFGAEVPFLLRPKGDGYLVIGECYVYDLMHGEILEKLAADPEGQLKAEWIKLI